MITNIKQTLIIALISILIVLGIGYYLRFSLFDVKKVEDTTLMLEKIKKVTKLISVEGQFSELYHYNESVNYDFFGLFSKKIILRVNAKVSVGYDFENINITIDSLKRTVTLNELPRPEVLSIDHDIDYFDISQGTFNKFTKEEYNSINKKAKDIIAKKAKETELINVAEQQKGEYLEMIEMALQSAGWTLVAKPSLGKLN